MSGDMTSAIAPLDDIVEALQGAITSSDIVSFFATGVTVALPLILTWFGARWINKCCHEVQFKGCEVCSNV